MDVTFIPDSTTATILSGALTLTHDNAIANGVAQNEVKAMVTDATGNGVPNQVVTFSANNNTVIAASGTTDANGSATLTFTNIKSGITQGTAK